jgi:hypothetical protein
MKPSDLAAAVLLLAIGVTLWRNHRRAAAKRRECLERLNRLAEEYPGPRPSWADMAYDCEQDQPLNKRERERRRTLEAKR